MSDTKSDAPTERYEPVLTEDEFTRLHEMILRQFDQMCKSDEHTMEELHEYGRAYDTFLDTAGARHFIRDQPEEIQEIWDEIWEDSL